MAFLEQRIDERIERQATGGPTNRGRVKIYTGSGKLQQGFYWSAPLHEFNISLGIREELSADKIKSLWYVVNFTPYEGFRFRWWRDYIATATNTAVENTTGTEYQLQRKHTFGGVDFLRNIYKPNSDVAVFEANGTPCTFTTDTTTGIVDVSSGTPAYWTGTFDFPVTFRDGDFIETLDGNIGNLAISPPNIVLEEIRL